MAQADIEGEQPHCELDEDGCANLFAVMDCIGWVESKQIIAVIFGLCRTASRLQNEGHLRLKEIKRLCDVRLHQNGNVHSSTFLDAIGNNSPAAEDERDVLTSFCRVLGWMNYFKPLKECGFEVGMLGDEVYEKYPFPTPLQQIQEAVMRHVPMQDVDEGIAEDEPDHASDPTFDAIAELCSKILEADDYHGLLRSLVHEALDISTFLARVVDKEFILQNADKESGSEINVLHFSDWSRLWRPVVGQVEEGVRLRSVPKDDLERSHPLEYPLTPYELLMSDISRRNYNLKQVKVDREIPNRVKKDAHSIILDLIRNHPPLKSASERTLGLTPEKYLTPRENLNISIEAFKLSNLRRSRETLSSAISTSHLEVFSRSLTSIPTAVRSNSKHPQTKEKICLMDTDFQSLRDTSSVPDDLDDDDMSSSDDDFFFDRDHVARPRSMSYADVSKASSAPTSIANSSEDLKNGSLFQMRRSQTQQEKLLHQITDENVDCLALTLEELVHIRTVLTRIDVDTLLYDKDLYKKVSKGKICYGCRKTVFGIFTCRPTKCYLCQQTVCRKCFTKLRIPMDHFANIPVVALSPPGTPRDDNDLSLLKSMVGGSAPNTPQLSRSNDIQNVCSKCQQMITKIILSCKARVEAQRQQNN